MKATDFFQVSKNILFPPKCVCCGELLNPYKSSAFKLTFCEKCLDKWNEELAEECASCHLPASECTCVPRLFSENSMDRLSKLVFYKPGKTELPSSRLIYSIKRYNNKIHFDFLADLLYIKVLCILSEKGIDVNSDSVLFTFPPRRYASVSEYGFDQSKKLALAVSKKLGKKKNTVVNAFKRHGGSEQKKLNAEQRTENIVSAYTLRTNQNLKNKNVFLFDDVVTTGSSMVTCCNLLTKAGVENVFCVSIAQTKNKF